MYITDTEREFKNNKELDILLVNLEKLEFVINTVYTKEFMFTGIDNQSPLIKELIISEYDETNMKIKRKYYLDLVAVIHSLIEENSNEKYTSEINTLYQDLCSSHVIFIDDASGSWEYKLQQSR